MPEPAPLLRDVFDLALALPESERTAYVSRIAGSHPDLGRELQALLEADAAAGTFLAAPAASHVPLFNTDLTGLTLGPYRVLQRIGSGGMGAVYLAERVDDSFERRVAIKVVRLGFGIEERIARFQRERHILAQLDHPNIARLIDGGTLTGGVPYLVMEYIEGQPIDRSCEERSLPLAARLRLVIKVCAAVNFAHQRLVIHRDIKPNNILVDGEGEPKLLDFGIATILEPTGLEHDQLTRAGSFIVTPDYASPEQVRGELVTTASDVYALGVVLYLLLTGRTPYHVASQAPQEIVRAVCETEAAPPSAAVLATEGGAPPSHQARRLSRELRGDLDTIVLKALHKDVSRRYSSPARLADDLQRHLDGRPVLARPDTLAYRLNKFVRRNRAGAMLAAGLVAAIAIGTVATLWQAGEATRQQAIAERRLSDIRRLATSFLFDIHDAIAELPGAAPARLAVVSRGTEYLDRLALESGEDQALQAELADAYDRLAGVQGDPSVANLGDEVSALRSYRKALAIREALVAQRAMPPADARRDVSWIRIGDALAGGGHASQAAPEYERALALRETALAADPGDPSLQLAVLEAAERLCVTPGVSPDAAARANHCSRALAQLTSPSRAPPEAPDLRRRQATVLLALGSAQRSAGAFAEAERTLRSAAEAFSDTLLRTSTGPGLVRGRALSLGALGASLDAQGRHADALAAVTEGVSLMEGLLRDDPASTRTRLDLASLLRTEAQVRYHLGQRREAIALADRSLAVLPTPTDLPGGGSGYDEIVRDLEEIRRLRPPE
jgi:non-specific serine/threonine protein kinase/serine/threonine-protein kinase